MRTTRNSLNINTAQIGDENKLFDVLTDWKPQAVLCMNGFEHTAGNIVLRIQEHVAGWGGIVIYRPFEEHEPILHLKKSPKDHIEFIHGLGLAQSGIWVNVFNEPIINGIQPAQMLTKWLVEFIDRAMDAQILAVLPNFATGSISKQLIDDGHFDEMLKKVADLRRERVNGFNKIALGFHVYSHAHLAVGEGIGYGKLLDRAWAATPSMWPAFGDIWSEEGAQNNWLVGRDAWWYLRMHEITDANFQDTVDTHYTEGLLDDIADVARVNPTVYHNLNARYVDNPTGGNKAAGWVTLIKYYKWLAGEHGIEWPAMMAETIKWLELNTPPHVRSFCNFSWTTDNHPPNFWAGEYGMGNGELDALLNTWTGYKAEIEELWENERIDDIEVTVTLPAGTQLWNVRELPSTSAPRVGTISNNDKISMVQDTPIDEGGWWWTPVVVKGVHGWLAFRRTTSTFGLKFHDNEGNLIDPLIGFLPTPTMVNIPIVTLQQWVDDLARLGMDVNSLRNELSVQVNLDIKGD
jgi:hypothetical protein